MFQNYVKVALRNLLQRRFYALVTLTGLSVSMTFLLLIGNYIQGELAVNASLRNRDRQYLVQSRWKVKEMGYEIGSLAPIGPTLKRLYPDLVTNYYRNYGVGAIMANGQTYFREEIQVGDSTLISMFGFAMQYGDPETALLEPNSVVITSAIAQKYFGQSNVLRRQLTIQTPRSGKQLFTITGVLSALPDNSVTHLSRFNGQVFIPMHSFGYFADEASLNAWDNRTLITYLELQPGITAQQLTCPFLQVLKTYAPQEIQDNLQLYLSPLTTYYLKADNGLVEKMLLLLSITALFILFMAVVNFVNVSVGMSATRLREIGVRKVLGSSTVQITGQFLAEALLLTVVATGLALLGHEVFHVAFANVLNKPIASLLTWSPLAFVGLAGLVLLIGLLAGFYPAFVLSHRHPVESLRGKLGTVIPKGISLQRMLIIFQFTVAIFVFIGSLVISRQVAYFFSKDLGYQKAQLMTIASVPRDWSMAGVQRMEGIRDQLAHIPGISNVSLSFEIPDGSSSGSVRISPQGRDSTQAITANTITADSHFALTYGLKLSAGEFFRTGTDSAQVVLNESAVSALGWESPEKALNQTVRFRGEPFRVRGVLKDFHAGSLHQSIKPLVFIQVQKDPIYRYFSLRLKPGQLNRTIAAIGQEWARLLPDAPFDYAFMDDTLQKLYQAEIQLQRAARLATLLSLFIVLLGILGLVSLNVTRRTREIGIRKVLGSSTLGIVNLFLKEFIPILLLANSIAWPLAYYLLNGWLARFTYQIDWSWAPFGFVTFVLTLLTGFVVSTQVIRAAITNPIKSLRSE